MFYLELFRALNRAGARYLVVGGVALNLHGVPRMTADLDLMLALDPRNLSSTLHALESIGLSPAIPVAAQDLLDPDARERWLIEKHMLAFPFANASRPFEAVDLLIHPGIDFTSAWEKRTIHSVAGIPVPTLCIEDLIQQKRDAGRPQDLADAAALERLRRREEA